MQRERFSTLPDALEHLEGTLRPIAARTDRPAARVFAREIDPSAQVAVRGEIAGPGGLSVGVDVHGDGSCSAFRGKWRRRAIEPGDREDSFQALRRVLS